jgi:hypothetical protein
MLPRIAVLAVTAVGASTLLPHTRLSQEVARGFCQIDSTGRTSGRSADICDAVVHRWRALLGPNVPIIPGTIAAEPQPGEGGFSTPTAWRLSWTIPTTQTNVVRRKRDGVPAYDAANVLPHEAGHRLWTSYLNLWDSVGVRAHYGTPAADWFDEAPAVWMESAAERGRYMTAIVGSRPSLVALATLTHPNLPFVQRGLRDSEFKPFQQHVLPPCAQCTWWPESIRTKYRVTEIGINRQGGVDTITRFLDQSPIGTALEETQFYGLSYSLLRFIRLRGGTPAVHALVARYKANPYADVNAVLGLPGLPTTAAAFEREWHAFLKQPPAEER